MLNEIQHERFKKITSSVLYLPHFLSWAVFGGILFSLFSATTGSIPRFMMNTFNVSMPSLITDPKYARGFLYATNIWKEVGWNTIIYMAAIAGIDQQLYESAVIDGANHFQEIWHITLPCIRTTIATLLVLSVGDIMSAGFDQIFNLYNPLVMETADIIDTWVYRVGLVERQYSLGTAVGLLRSIVGIILMLSANKIAQKVTDYRIF